MLFDRWLVETRIITSQVVALRKVRSDLNAAWPYSATDRKSFEEAINTLPGNDRPAAQSALNDAWITYENTGNSNEINQGRLVGFLTSSVATKSLSFLVLSLIGFVIVYMFFGRISSLTLEDLGRVEISRGLLTLLFGVTTVCVALIIVLAVFLGDGPKDELSERFQRGKDILTVLIGVFGAILGYYFGSDTDKNAVQKQKIEARDNSGVPAPESKLVQPPKKDAGSAGADQINGKNKGGTADTTPSPKPDTRPSANDPPSIQPTSRPPVDKKEPSGNSK